MRKLLLLSLTAILVAALATPIAVAKKAPKEVPFKGMFSGDLLDFNTEDLDFIAERCPNSPDGRVAYAVASFEGWGTATHMGRTYINADHCSYANMNTGMPDGTYGQGVLTMFAANGDMLSATYANGISLSPPPVVEFVDFFTFDNEGTGRFNFASGGGIEMGSANFDDFTFNVQMAGVISYSKR